MAQSGAPSDLLSPAPRDVARRHARGTMTDGRFEANNNHMVHDAGPLRGLLRETACYWCTFPSRRTSFSATEKAFLCKVFCQSGTPRIPCLRSLCICTFPKSVHFDPLSAVYHPPSAAYTPCPLLITPYMWLDD